MRQEDYYVTNLLNIVKYFLKDSFYITHTIAINGI